MRLNLDDVRDICEAVSYKPGWHIRTGDIADGFFAQWAFPGTHEMQRGRKWYISPHCTRSEVVQTLLKAAITAEEHETREQFLYKGVAVFGPHLDVDLLAVANYPETRRLPLAQSE